MIANWPSSWTWAIGEIGGTPPPTLSLECAFCLPYPLSEPASRMPPQNRNVVLRLSGLGTDWTHLRILYNLLRYGGQVQNLLILQLPMTNLLSKFPCILNLPSTNLEWPAFFFCLTLPSVYGAQFQINLDSSWGCEATLLNEEDTKIFASQKLHFCIGEK